MGDDAGGIDPLYDLGPLPGGDILFRPGASDDVLGSALSALPSTGFVGSDDPVQASAPVRDAPIAPAPTPRPVPPPQGYIPPQTYGSPRPRPRTPAPPVDLRAGGSGRRRPALEGRPGTAGGTIMTLLRWALKHPRVAFATGFALVAVIANLGSALSFIDSDHQTGSQSYSETAPAVVGPGPDGMTYFPWLVPQDVGEWQVVVENATTEDVTYVVQDETTGELLAAATTPAFGRDTYTVPDERLDHRIAVVHDPSDGAGLLSCQVLADGIEVATATSDSGLTCTYDPTNLQS